MKTQDLCNRIEKLIIAVDKEIIGGTDLEIIRRLHDTKEYMVRAWHKAKGSEYKEKLLRTQLAEGIVTKH